jgi:hypothetical protein
MIARPSEFDAECKAMQFTIDFVLYLTKNRAIPTKNVENRKYKLSS